MLSVLDFLLNLQYITRNVLQKLKVINLRLTLISYVIILKMHLILAVLPFKIQQGLRKLSRKYARTRKIAILMYKS